MGPSKSSVETIRSRADVTGNVNTKSFERNSLKKKDLINIVKTEFEYISNLFDVLDIASLNHGRRNLSEEEDEENFQVADVPEKKLLKKQGMKKGSQMPSKMKSFPQTIDGLEKELEELKGTPMTYLKKLRKKGLQSRLVKKKRKEDIKQQKAALKSNKKHKTVMNGPAKLVKPVLNSDGSVVSSKFDFADNKLKKENKRKAGATNEIDSESKVFRLDKQVNNIKEDPNKTLSATFSGNNSVKENTTIDDKESLRAIIKSENVNSEKSKAPLHEGPVYNKENKMVFSKVFLPENGKKSKKKTEKDPKKILQKIKENTKKISELEKEDKEKAASLKEKQKWAAALKRASGEKVKDDPELLRKSIAREKNKKLRSQKKWQARIDRVQKEKDEKQKKRTENLQARKSEKKKRKMKKAVKKGSFVQV